MLALLGITFVASLSGDALVKGLIAGGLGFFLATVGMDPISGIQRYTFGQLFLWDGIGLVPITIGLFAIPRSLTWRSRVEHCPTPGGKLGGVVEGVKDTFRHWSLVLRCSAPSAPILASFLVWAAGSARWLAYAHAVQSSPQQGALARAPLREYSGRARRTIRHWAAP